MGRSGRRRPDARARGVVPNSGSDAALQMTRDAGMPRGPYSDVVAKLDATIVDLPAPPAVRDGGDLFDPLHTTAALDAALPFVSSQEERLTAEDALASGEAAERTYLGRIRQQLAEHAELLPDALSKAVLSEWAAPEAARLSHGDQLVARATDAKLTALLRLLLPEYERLVVVANKPIPDVRPALLGGLRDSACAVHLGGGGVESWSAQQLGLSSRPMLAALLARIDEEAVNNARRPLHRHPWHYVAFVDGDGDGDGGGGGGGGGGGHVGGSGEGDGDGEGGNGGEGGDAPPYTGIQDHRGQPTSLWSGRMYEEVRDVAIVLRALREHFRSTGLVRRQNEAALFSSDADEARDRQNDIFAGAATMRAVTHTWAALLRAECGRPLTIAWAPLTAATVQAWLVDDVGVDRVVVGRASLEGREALLVTVLTAEGGSANMRLDGLRLLRAFGSTASPTLLARAAALVGEDSHGVANLAVAARFVLLGAMAYDGSTASYCRYVSRRYVVAPHSVGDVPTDAAGALKYQLQYLAHAVIDACGINDAGEGDGSSSGV